MLIYLAMSPIPQQRPRVSTIGGKPRMYNSQHSIYLKIRNLIRLAIGLHYEPISCPIRVWMSFGIPWPKAASKRRRLGVEAHTVRPDLTNLTKLIEDCGNGLIWQDDSRIADLRLQKYYAEIPHVAIEVRCIDRCCDKHAHCRAQFEIALQAETCKKLPIE
jgi:Holliday junction resolvase RusA-like endonuclease